MISGYLLTLSAFGWPLLIAGTVKGTYDILLLIKFQKLRPPEEAAAPKGLTALTRERAGGITIQR